MWVGLVTTVYWRRSYSSSGKKNRGRSCRAILKGYILPICGEAPSETMYIKICLVGVVLDVITCAKFQNEILGGYDFTGVEFCAACDCLRRAIIERYSVRKTWKTPRSMVIPWWNITLGPLFYRIAER